jgi:hypothetical protein
MWDTRGFSAVVSDPFTNPANADNQFTSPSTRTKKNLGLAMDSRRAQFGVHPFEDLSGTTLPLHSDML